MKMRSLKDVILETGKSDYKIEPDFWHNSNSENIYPDELKGLNDNIINTKKVDGSILWKINNFTKSTFWKVTKIVLLAWVLNSVVPSLNADSEMNSFLWSDIKKTKTYDHYNNKKIMDYDNFWDLLDEYWWDLVSHSWYHDEIDYSGSYSELTKRMYKFLKNSHPDILKSKSLVLQSFYHIDKEMKKLEKTDNSFFEKFINSSVTNEEFDSIFNTWDNTDLSFVLDKKIKDFYIEKNNKYEK